LIGLFFGEKMNIRELANVAGVSVETIRRTGKTLFPENFKKGVKTIFTKDQCFDIMSTVSKKNMVQMQPPQSVEEPPQSVEVIAQAVAIAMQSVMLPMMEKMFDKASNLQKALPGPIKEDYYSLVAYCAIKGMQINRSELALHGKELKKIANRQKITLKKIPDERWGFVNSYPVAILDEYFAV
jgi:hypothetical protein